MLVQLKWDILGEGLDIRLNRKRSGRKPELDSSFF